MTKFGWIYQDTELSLHSQAIPATPAATVTLDITAGAHAKWTAAQNETVVASGTQFAGQELVCIITNHATAARTITFGTGFKAASTLVGIVNKVAVVRFISNGTNFYESSRVLGLPL